MDEKRVRKWLAGLGFPLYAKLKALGGVDGNSLVHATDAALLEWGVLSAGDRTKILGARDRIPGYAGARLQRSSLVHLCYPNAGAVVGPSTGHGSAVPVAEAQFYDALSSASLEGKAGRKLLTLTTADVRWGGDNSMGDSLFVRDTWNVFLELVVKGWQHNSISIVLGTPGIGKTTFLWYLMWHRLRKDEGSSVFVLEGERYNTVWRKLFVFIDGKLARGEIGGIGSFADEVADNKTYYLVDGVPFAKVCSKRTLQVSSPHKQRWHESSKDTRAVVRVMPGWSFQELSNAAEALQSPLAAELEKRYAVLGGTFRYVLTHPETDHKLAVQRTMRDVDLEKVVQSDGGLGCDTGVSNLLVHLYPDEDDPEFLHKRVFTDFASPFVARQVRRALERKLQDKFHTLVQFSGSTSAVSKAVCSRISLTRR